MMRICAAVPVKEPARAKSRLAGAVGDRGAFALAMLDRVLRALTGCPALAEIAVVSPDPGVLRYAASRGLATLAQDGTGLNEACGLALSWAQSRGADALLVAHGDLPWLQPSDVSAMARALTGPRGIVLAPDRHGQGTNALLLAPPQAFGFAFGPASFRRHLEEARRLALDVAVHRSRGTEHDVDLPGDLLDLPEALSAAAS